MKLVFTSDHMPGYRRHRSGRGFSYRLPDGTILTDRSERRRIRSLVIPPAYKEVWICMLENGHLQATGLDARGRKQYRYHPAWHEHAAERKFGQLAGFAAALPRIRAAVRKELAGNELTRERVIAGVVLLLDETGYRIGNTRYERDNGTHGIASLLTRHLREEENGLQLRFVGKSGQRHETIVSNPRLTRLLGELQDLPGQHLFRYESADGGWRDLDSSDVNSWLHEITGADYTAKIFRTWKATVGCARGLAANPPPDSRGAREQVIREAIKATAARLNHTAATCRKFYVHPAVLRSYRSEELNRIMRSRPPALRKSDGTASLRADERRVYRILTIAPIGITRGRVGKVRV